MWGLREGGTHPVPAAVKNSGRRESALRQQQRALPGGGGGTGHGSEGHLQGWL